MESVIILSLVMNCFSLYSIYLLREEFQKFKNK
jgi:hypothetical protein